MGREMDARRLGGSGKHIKVAICSDPPPPTLQLLPVLLIPFPINMSCCHINGCKWTPRRASVPRHRARRHVLRSSGPFLSSPWIRDTAGFIWDYVSTCDRGREIFRSVINNCVCSSDKRAHLFTSPGSSSSSSSSAIRTV